MYSIGSKCEWNWSTTVNGTLRRCSVKRQRRSYYLILKILSKFSLTYDESHSDVIGESDSVTNANKFPTTSYGHHTQTQWSTDAETSSARCKPKFHSRLRYFTLFLFQRRKYFLWHTVSAKFFIQLTYSRWISNGDATLGLPKYHSIVGLYSFSRLTKRGTFT